MDTSLALQVIKLMDEMFPDESHLESDDLDLIAKRMNAILEWGATRWALVFKKHGLVVKFPRYEETDNDYCAIEFDNYQVAKKYGIERCLLPIEFVGTAKNSLPIYVQPMYSFSQNDISKEIAKRWDSKMKNLDRAPIVRKVQQNCLYSPTRFWLRRAIQIYGKAFMRSFEKWTQECQVNDLHNSNIGYLGKQPIIIDYAGFHH